MNYEGKNGTPDDKSTDILNNLFLETPTPKIDDTDEVLETPILVIDLDVLDKQTYEKAKVIAERLAYYFLDGQVGVFEHVLGFEYHECVNPIRS